MSQQLFLKILKEGLEDSSEPRLTSPIKQWLGRECSQSISVRMGNFIEEYFNQLMPNNIREDLTLHNSQWCIQWDDEWHQVDLLSRRGNRIYHRELKCNLTLGHGPKRDVRRREKAIVSALEHKYKLQVDSSVFCPFIPRSRFVSNLGMIEGLQDFIEQFDIKLTVDEFQQLGSDSNVHGVLFGV